MARKTPRQKHGKRSTRQGLKKARAGKGARPPRSSREDARRGRPQGADRRDGTVDKAEIEEAFRRFEAANPGARGELEHVDPYTLLVAVVLSAQATDAGVNKATPALFAAADTPEKMVTLGEAKVRDFIKTIGLFRMKAKNVDRAVEKTRRRARRQGADVARGAGSTAGRRPQDRQRGAQHRLRRADHRGRHPHLPRRQPHRAGARQDAARGRGQAGRGGAGRLQAPRPPLADPARTLCLRRAPAAVREMPDRRSLQMAGQDRCPSEGFSAGRQGSLDAPVAPAYLSGQS